MSFLRGLERIRQPFNPLSQFRRGALQRPGVRPPPRQPTDQVRQDGVAVAEVGQGVHLKNTCAPICAVRVTFSDQVGGAVA
jgi:hypothetical protein